MSVSLSFNSEHHRALVNKSLDETLSVFAKERVMAVIRTDDMEDAIWGGRLLLESGFRILDVTYGTPNVERIIETLSKEFPNALVGAGTVLTQKQASDALAAGASFLASPVLDRDILAFGNEYKLLVLPGVSTPTEMMNAMHWGAHALKFFPAESFGGAPCLKTIKAPLPHLPIVATGGITSETMADYWAAGALAVGIGNELLPKASLAKRDEQDVKRRVQAVLAKRDAYLATK